MIALKLMNCERCGCQIVRTVHNKKYCEKCTRIIRAERQRGRYHRNNHVYCCSVCGEIFRAKTPDVQTCPTCRYEERERNWRETWIPLGPGYRRIKGFCYARRTVTRLARLLNGASPRPPAVEIRRAYRGAGQHY